MSAGISIGTQVVAPDGYRALERGVTYYFLKSASGTVYLVEFVERPARQTTRKRPNGRLPVQQVPTPVPYLLQIPREDFESGLLDGRIVRAEHQHLLPPWLDELEGRNLDSFDARRRSARLSHSARVNRKLELIDPLVRGVNEILAANNPDQIINAHARRCKPRQNETRLRLAFYTYLVFGRNPLALHYPIHRIGHWSRADHPSQVKRGSPSYKGKGHGHNATPEMIEQIIDYYARKVRPGKGMGDIYSDFMTEIGCLEREGPHGYLTYWHPRGLPFPTEDMFKYYVRQSFSREQIQVESIGRVRTRSKFAPHCGKFTQNVCNAYERVEMDAYTVKELPRGLIEGSTLGALYVVRLRDVASGLITGIGFSLGSETAAAYRMARFCQAVDKVHFCKLFGIPITPNQWPSIGVSTHDIQDRGPGSTDGAFAHSQVLQPVIREIPPSYSGQSKAIVESSHPKNPYSQDTTSHVKSAMSVFQLVTREILRVIKDNDSMDIGERLTPDLLPHVRKLTPIGLFHELDRRGRNDALQISFEDAVRAYLTKQAARLTRNGIELCGQTYASEILRASDAMRHVHGEHALPVDVYVMDACVRHIWMDVEGVLVALDLQAPMIAGNDELYLSLADLVTIDKHLHRHRRALGEHCSATRSKTKRAFTEESGQAWHAGSRISGRPRRGTKVARQEAAESKAAMQLKERP
jgi:hypothetical protein